MFSAIENERLATSKRLEMIYKRDTERAMSQVEEYWSFLIEEENRWLDEGMSAYPDIVSQEIVLGALIWNSDGRLFYPQKITLGISSPLPLNLDWQQAQNLEFQEKDFLQAKQAYLRILEEASDTEKANGLLANVLIAVARCEYKQGNRLRAFEYYESLSHIKVTTNPSQPVQHNLVIGGLLRALEIAIEEYTPRPDPIVVDNIASKVIDALNDYTTQMLSSNQRLYTMNKFLEMAQSLDRIYGIEDKFRFKTHEAEKVVNSSVLPSHLNDMGTQWLDEKIFVFTGPNARLSLLVKKPLFEHSVKNIITRFVDGPELTVVIRTNSEAAPDSDVDIFFKKSLSGVLGGLTVYLYADNTNYFERENMARVGVYLGTGSSIIVLLIISSVAVLLRMRGQERLNQLKSDVMATVSHELKTPLSSVKLLVENMVNDSNITDPKIVEYIHIIGEENERLTRLVNNFLEYTCIDRDKYVFSFEHLTIQSVIDMALKITKHKFERAGVDFQQSAIKEDTWVYADRDKICITLINLLENAFKYTGKKKHIELSIEKSSEYVFIRVSDNGVGLSQTDQEKIFDQFYRVDQNLSRATEGCGLGLYISSYFIKKHNGKILVESELGKGSEFTIKLPISTINLKASTRKNK